MDAPKALDPSLPPGSKLGPYLLERRIAAGGMAEIYLARTQGMAGFEKQLALKVIHADMASDAMFVKMLVAEAKLAVQLAHANIVQTFDLGRIGETYFITMEYIDGSDYFELLRAITKQDREVPIDAALYVAQEVAAALDYAHNKTDDQGKPLGLIHRDISPQNVLLSRHGQVKIADFGIAKVANVSSQTRAGTIKGKLVYMSPEQAWGERVDARSDIFSAGVVLYEALTGGSLYSEENPVKLLHHVRKAEIPPPSSLRPELSEALDAMVMKALARQPEDRYQNAAEFGAELTLALRRINPTYASRELAQLVSSVIGAQSSPGSTKSRRRSVAVAPVPAASAQEPMERRDYVVSQHSLIYDSEELTPVESPSAQRAQKRAEAPAVHAARVVLALEQGNRVLDVGDELLIGRGNPELALTDGRVSRRHAQILKRESGYYLEDLRSANGTFLNQQRIEQLSPLQPGDVIRIGPYELRFVTEAHDEATRPSGRAQAAGASGQRAAAGPPADGAGLEQAYDAPTPPPQRVDQPLVAAEPPGPALLVLDLAEQTMRLPIDAALVLDHKLDVGPLAVPVVHATVQRRDDGYWLEPAQGHGPVTLNEQLIDEPRRLSSGDKLKIGFLEATFTTELDE